MNEIKKRAKNILAIEYLLVCLITAYTAFVFYNKSSNIEQNVTIAQAILLISVPIYILSNIYIGNKLTDPIILLLVTLFVFGIGKVLLDFFGLTEFAQVSWFSSHISSNPVKFKVLTSYTLALHGILIGCNLYILITKNKIDKVYSIEPNMYIYRIATKIFYVSMIFFIYKNAYIGFTVVKNGYMNMYANGIRVPGGGLVNLASYIFKFSFYLILASMAEKSKIKNIIYVYILCLGIMLTTGNRGDVFSEILMIVTYLALRKDFNINFIKIAIIGLLIIFMSFGVEKLRLSESDYGRTKINNPIITFIDEQGGSINVLSATIENEYKLKKGFSYVLHPVIFGDFGKLVEKDFNDPWLYRVKTHSLPHEISYIVNESIYRSGGGMGGNYIAELYMIKGLSSIFIFNILIGVLLQKLKYNILKNRKYIFYSMYILPYIYMMPRDYTLGFMITIFRPILFIILLNLVCKKKILS